MDAVVNQLVEIMVVEIHNGCGLLYRRMKRIEILAYSGGGEVYVYSVCIGQIKGIASRERWRAH